MSAALKLHTEKNPITWKFIRNSGNNNFEELDYYPFGMQMPDRKSSTDEYRYGFQGQEKDDELKGEGNSLNYEYRMHDPRIGRFFAVDPLAAKYAYNSPYAFSENRVIDGVELEGLEHINLNTEFTDENGITVTAKEKFKDRGWKIEEFNGEFYYKIQGDPTDPNDTYHLSYRSDGEAYGLLFHKHATGPENAEGEYTLISEWIYKDIPDEVLKLDPKNLELWGVSKKCNVAAQNTASNLGTDTGEWDWDGYSPNSGANLEYNVPNVDEQILSTDYIHRELEKGNVIIIGMDYDVHSVRPADEANGIPNLYGTDHFLVIVDRGVINGNENVFFVYENAAKDTEEGTQRMYNNTAYSVNVVYPEKGYTINTGLTYLRFSRTGGKAYVTWVKENPTK